MAKIHQIAQYILYQKSTDKSVATLKSYEGDLVHFSKWFRDANGEELRLSKVTPTDMRQYKQFMIDAMMKPQTINRRLLSLKYFIEWGVDTKRIKYRLPLPKRVKQAKVPPQWLTKQQQNRLLRYAERYGNVRDRSIVVILLNTGLRVSELCALKWCNITMSERKGNLHVVNGKGSKYRTVPLNKDTRFALDNLGYKNFAGSNNSIFVGQRGPLNPRGIQLILKRLLKNTDLEMSSPHQLRHTFCKNLVNAGVSLEKVATLAGHEQLETTKLYCHPSLSDLGEAIEKIGELDACA
ncbi:uncharacterized protein LOC111347597 [Stylophora pistillata]|uniref:uncharacterized protein LOC111347597 n=1 Tax=Stylophora pistillata TaxID=50429 RepID=UPI000C05373F|nr:uncharacterized protein LOC111347597 [Stylophora pistillata]